MPLSHLILLILFFLTPCTSWAQAQSTSVIPYSGTLFSQGKPVSQDNDVLMAFALYTGDVELALSSEPSESAPDTSLNVESPAFDRLWTSWETENGTAEILSDLTLNNPHIVGVKVRNGRFLVHLGASGQESLPNTIFDQRPLYVVTWIVNGSGVFRLPPQKLETIPHAVTAERANSFEVMENLTVVGTTRMRGKVVLDPPVPWPANESTLQINNHHGSGPTLFGYSGANGISYNYLRGRTDLGDRSYVHGRFDVEGRLVVGGEITLSSNLKADSNSYGTCGWVSCNNALSGGSTVECNCGSARFMAGIKYQDPEHDGSDTDRTEGIYCCEL
jgi:hypothetical protein